MKKKLLTAMLAVCSGLCANAAASYDFETGGLTWGKGWGNESSAIVSNPYKCGNTSDYCLHIVTTGWGLLGYENQDDLSAYYIAVDVFSMTDCTMKIYSEGLNDNKYFTIEKGKWQTVFADFKASSKSGIGSALYFGPSVEAGEFYIDNVRAVSSKTGAVSCSEAYTAEECKNIADFTFGQLAMGGGGFVPGVIAQGKTKIARTDVGGAYKWNYSSSKWEQITTYISEDNKGLYSIEGIAIDPQNENNIYLLAGNQYFSSQKTAVLCSKDGGKTFTTSDITSIALVHGNGDGRNCGERIAVDPNNSSIIYSGARARNPLIRSTDGGANWETVSSFPSSAFSNSINWPSWESNSVNTTADENGTTAVVFDGSSVSGGKTQRIFVGISSTNTANVYVSEDGGSSWSTISSLPTNLIPCRMKMDKNGNLLIAYSDKKAYGSNGAIYRYNPNTKTAENISPATGYAFGDVAVSPNDANKLVVSTNSTWVPQAWENGSSANGDIIWVSTDGGKNWTNLNGKFTLKSNGVTWISGYALHWCGTVCIDPTTEKVSFGSGNGIFSCDDIWTASDNYTFYFDVKGIEETVPLDAVSIPCGGNFLSVIGDYTGFIHTDLSTYPAIHDPAPGTTGGINYYSGDHNIQMRVANSGFYITTTGAKGWKKTSANTSYSYSNPYCSSCNPYPSNEGKCAITKKADGTMRYFVIPGPGESGIFYSDNEGASWTKVSGTDKATHIQVDPENDELVYAGGKQYFYSSSDYGTTFTSQALSNGDYGRIAVVNGVEGLVYAPGGSNGLYVSVDKGEKFTKVENVTSCDAVGVGVGKDGKGYVIYLYGSVYNCTPGIYFSEDEGATWTRATTDSQQFGGPGNGQFILGDWNVYGRVYMSSIGMGIIYGEYANKAAATASFCDGTNVNEAKAEKAVVITPNPFSETATLYGEGDYTITNMLGAIVEEGTANGTAEIGANLSNGVYVVLFNGNAAKLIKK